MKLLNGSSHYKLLKRPRIFSGLLNLLETMDDFRKIIRSMKLVYSNDHLPGYTRKRKGNSFIYLDDTGKIIQDQAILYRLKALVLPPAWTSIWICKKANGHLQATGFDVGGRKQYRYHSNWSKYRNDIKHDCMLSFGIVLPKIREQIEKDLCKTNFSKEKVIALCIKILDQTLMRIGNHKNVKRYGSYGLTTLRNKHIKIIGCKIKISFKGKKGVFQDIEFTHARLARLIKKVKVIPGQELFQYYDEAGNLNSIDSGCVNDYLKAYGNEEFTAKDFRTWAGTVNAFLAQLDPFNTEKESKRNINLAIDNVASKLGNTRAVCKKYSIHPKLLSYYEEGKIWPYLTRLKKLKSNSESTLLFKPEEKIILQFLKKEVCHTKK